MSFAQTKSNKHGFPKAKLVKRVHSHSQKLHFATKVSHKGLFLANLRFISGSKLPHFNKIGNLVLLKNHVLVPKIRPGLLVWFLLTKLASSYLPKQVKKPVLGGFLIRFWVLTGYITRYVHI